MLWFDNDKQYDLNIRVNRAASYYRNKYGQKPNLCYVHPCMISANNLEDTNGREKTESSKSTEVEIKESIEILPNHFWIGINRKEI